ncbi:hypothetical protein ACTMTI_22340 [Nonomuraea sp. H19]|uniref:hypothetical protein n=1 Tax=Nonomuraea sp. H19 TaxID=3452206 RepID=UPI003F8AEC3B
MTQESYRQENERGSNSFQHGTNNINNISVDNAAAGTGQDAEGTEDAADDSAKKPSLRFFFVPLIAIAILGVIIEIANGGSTPPSPAAAPRKPWPSGISREMLLASVAEKLTHCAKEPVLEPRNCPQHVYAQRAERVRWSLHGYPVDGADIGFDGRKFVVTGVAVMSVTYKDSDVEIFRPAILPYQAVVYQERNQIKLGSIVELKATPEIVAKRQSGRSSDVINEVVRNAFYACVSVNYSPMPQRCPQTGLTPSTENTAWELESDPLLNASHEFDDDTGILHIRGSYSAFMDGTNWFGRHQLSQAGDYDAWVLIDDSKIEVLDILHQE